MLRFQKKNEREIEPIMVSHNNFQCGAVHKRRPQSGGVSKCGHFSDKGGSSDADVRTFWSKILRIFRNLWCVRTDKRGGVEPGGHFADKGGGVNFSRFCADFLYGRTPVFSRLQRRWSESG